MTTQSEVTEEYTPTTLAEFRKTHELPILITVAGRGLEAAPAWFDRGIEPVSTEWAERIQDAAEKYHWAPETTLSIDNEQVGGLVSGGNSGDHAMPSCELGPMHESPFFNGYSLRVNEPGKEKRLVSFYDHRHRYNVFLHQTESEAEADQERRWAEYLASRSPERVIIDQMRALESRRRSQKDAQEQIDAEVREQVLNGLNANMRVADIARHLNISVSRVYQIRDGRR